MQGSVRAPVGVRDADAARQSVVSDAILSGAADICAHRELTFETALLGATAPIGLSPLVRDTIADAAGTSRLEATTLPLGPWRRCCSYQAAADSAASRRSHPIPQKSQSGSTSALWPCGFSTQASRDCAPYRAWRHGGERSGDGGLIIGTEGSARRHPRRGYRERRPQKASRNQAGPARLRRLERHRKWRSPPPSTWRRGADRTPIAGPFAMRAIAVLVGEARPRRT